MSSNAKVVAVEADGLTASLVVEPSKECGYLSLYVDSARLVVAAVASKGVAPRLQVDMGDGTVKNIDLRKLARHLERCDEHE